MSEKTKGHARAQPGLRGHSIGGGYPEIVIGVGSGWATFNTLTGDVGPVRGTYAEACRWRDDETRFSLLKGGTKHGIYGKTWTNEDR